MAKDLKLDKDSYETWEEGQGDGLKSANAPAPVGPYPHARRVGNLLFVSGMGPRKAGTREIPGVEFDGEGQVKNYDIREQTKSVIENISSVLQEAGCSLLDIVDVQVFLVDIPRDFKDFNEVYAEYFTEVGATRTTVEVNRLPTPIAVELKVIAEVKV